jgi:hypothetical protein
MLRMGCRFLIPHGVKAAVLLTDCKPTLMSMQEILQSSQEPHCHKYFSQRTTHTCEEYSIDKIAIPKMINLEKLRNESWFTVYKNCLHQIFVRICSKITYLQWRILGGGGQQKFRTNFSIPQHLRKIG